MSEQAERRVTLEREGVAELEEKKSIFIGRAKPITTEEEAQNYLKEIRAKFPDARHHVWAYRLQGDVVMRCSDDGEPQGTGGVPVLDVLKKSGVSNAIIVVTRYFGGILLGAGGLVRCYSKAAMQAVREARVVTLEKCRVWEIACSYADYNRLLAELSKFGAEAQKPAFEDRVTLRFTVRANQEEPLLCRLREMTGGTVVPEPVGELFLQVDSEN